MSELRELQNRIDRFRDLLGIHQPSDIAVLDAALDELKRRADKYVEAHEKLAAWGQRARERVRHRSGCEQNAGDAYCNCAAIAERTQPLATAPLTTEDAS